MELKSLIAESYKQYKDSAEKFYAQLALQLLIQSEALSLLSHKSKLVLKLSEVIEAAKAPSKSLWSSITHPTRANIDLQLELKEYAFTQARIISCPSIDEHSLLLACLKALEDKGILEDYKPVLKEMLQTSLHKLDRVQLTTEFMGRDKEISESLRILSREERNNLLLIGDVGVGKTALAQQLKLKLDGFKILQIYPGGDSFFDQIVNLLSQSNNTKVKADLKVKFETKVVFYLDEIFTFEVGQIKYLIDSAQVIGTANQETYRRFAADNPHITSKFEILRLDEPDRETTLQILERHIDRLSKQKQQSFAENFSQEIYDLAKKYLQDSNFPAKGITLLQESSSQALVQGLARVNLEIPKAIVSQKTNIPIGSLTDIDKQDLSKLAERIGSRVKGQEEAITKVAQAIQRSKLGFKKGNKPIGSFMFVGPSGVGKTELAKTLAKEIFGDEEAMIRLDMSEFAEAHMVQRLIGSPPGYVGYEEGGQLTNPVKEKPYSLILLDEIEKAHPRVFDIFLQVLDDGRLTDGRGQKIDFTNTIIIATSNAGIEDILDLVAAGKTTEEIAKEAKEVLQDYFRIEFINRFDDVVVFNALKPEALEGIARNQIQRLEGELEQRQIRLNIQPEFIAQLAKDSYDPRYGARGLLRLLQERIENVLAEGIINGEIKAGDVIDFPVQSAKIAESPTKEV